MALSGNITTNTSYWAPDNNYTSYKFSWTATQSITNNTSTVSWKIECICTNVNRGRSIQGGSYVTVNGTRYNISSGTIYYNGDTVKTGTTTVTHNDDGSKSFSVYVNISLGSSGSNSNTANTTFTLDTIARASTISLDKSSMVINGSNSVGITVSKRNSSFTDNLSYNFNGTTGTIVNNVGSSYSWVVPTSLLSAIPTTTSATCAITCTTYNGSTAIGTSTATITLSTDVVPTFQLNVLNTTEALDGTSYTAKWLRYISTGTVVGSAASQGATISSYKIANGATELGTSLPCNFSNLTSNTIVVSATDSRGVTASQTIELTPWVDYVMPTVSIDKLERVSNITATSQVNATLSGTITPSSSGLSVYATVTIYGQTIVPSLSSSNFSITTQIGTFAREQSYTITAVINDGFAEYTATAKLKRAVPVIHMGNDPTPHFDVEGNLIIHGDSAKIIWRDDNGTDWEMTLTKFKSLI